MYSHFELGKLFSVSKVETACTAETSLNICQATQRHIPEGCIIYSHGCDVTSLKIKLTVAWTFFENVSTLNKKTNCDVFAM
jgi:hypothetical protein